MISVDAAELKEAARDVAVVAVLAAAYSLPVEDLSIENLVQV